MKYCVMCGTKVSDEQLFCDHCGARQPVEAEARAAAAEGRTPAASVRSMTAEDAEVMSYAQNVMNEARTKKTMNLVGLVSACAATVSALIGVGTDHGVFLGVAVVLSIIAYALAGGFGAALKVAGKIAVCGFVCCWFPFSIFAGLATFMVAVMIFLFVPIVFVLISISRRTKEMKDAELYLAYADEGCEAA